MDIYRMTENWIKKYREFEAEIKNIDISIAEIKEQEQESVRAIDTTKEPTSKTYKFNSETENLGVRIADKLLPLEKRKKTLERHIQRIDNAMEALTEDERIIIQKAVIDGLYYYQFTYQIGCSERTCKRIKKRGIRKLAEILFSEQSKRKMAL